MLQTFTPATTAHRFTPAERTAAAFSARVGVGGAGAVHPFIPRPGTVLAPHRPWAILARHAY